MDEVPINYDVTVAAKSPSGTFQDSVMLTCCINTFYVGTI